MSAAEATCNDRLQVAITELLAQHAKSYNTDRSGVGYVACRCGMEIRLDGSSTADDARTLAAHQAESVVAEMRGWPVVAA